MIRQEGGGEGEEGGGEDYVKVLYLHAVEFYILASVIMMIEGQIMIALSSLLACSGILHTS